MAIKTRMCPSQLHSLLHTQVPITIAWPLVYEPTCPSQLRGHYCTYVSITIAWPLHSRMCPSQLCGHFKTYVSDTTAMAVTIAYALSRTYRNGHYNCVRPLTYVLYVRIVMASTIRTWPLQLSAPPHTYQNGHFDCARPLTYLSI